MCAPAHACIMCMHRVTRALPQGTCDAEPARRLQVKEQLRGPASVLLEEVSTVRSEVETAGAALRASQDRYLRLTADFDNFRKRTVRRSPPLCQRAPAGGPALPRAWLRCALLQGNACCNAPGRASLHLGRGCGSVSMLHAGQQASMICNPDGHACHGFVMWRDLSGLSRPD